VDATTTAREWKNRFYPLHLKMQLAPYMLQQLIERQKLYSHGCVEKGKKKKKRGIQRRESPLWSITAIACKPNCQATPLLKITEVSW
jgi:hypothetical protein